MGTALAAESLLSLAVGVTSEQRVEPVLQSIVQGLASQPGVALARIWLLPSADLPSFGHAVSDPADCLFLVASAGTPLNSPGEDWRFLQGHFARVRFNVGKVGQVAASRRPILVKDVAAQSDWVARPEWAKREQISSFAGHPLMFRDKLLGVIGLFSRQPLGQQEFTWLGLFANQAAVAIANACAEEALRASEHDLAGIINTIPTTAWTTRRDGYCDFLNQGWLDYAGMTAEQAQGWGWTEAIHPEDRQKLVEEWQSCLASGVPIDAEARIRRFDNSYRWFLIRANPLRDECGNILKWYGICTDIEDRKRGEESLRDSEQSLRLILDGIAGLVAIMSATGEVEAVNRQVLDYFGRSVEEMKGWSTGNAVHPDDLPGVIAAWIHSVETASPYDVDHRLRRADGVYRWFHARGLPLCDREGRVLRWYLLLTDIHDRRRTEEALRASEGKLQRVIDAIPTLAWCNLPDGPNEFLNKRWHAYTGLSPEEAHGWGWQTAFHPEDLPPLMKKWQEIMSSGEQGEIEARLRRNDGVYRWFLIRAAPFRDETGNIIRWYGTSTDIEDRKRAEEAVLANERNLGLIISTMPALAWSAHADGSVDFVNQRWLDYTGLSLVQAQGWAWTQAFHPDDIGRLNDYWLSTIAAGQPGEIEARLRRFDGKYRWFLFRASPLRDESGAVVKWYGTNTDIDDRKRAEEELRSAQLELARVMRVMTMEQLTASIAHEVSQPLSGIITNASTCLRMLDTNPPNLEGARETARRTIRDGHRASDVITRLRTLYSKKEPALEKMDLNEAVREVTALSSTEIQRNGVMLRQEFADDLPPALGDRIQLQQVILNLLRNATDAMSTIDDRPRELLVRTERDEGNQVRLSVKDSGVGYTPEVADKIFQAFYTTKTDGMGIGLSVSRSIIEAHQGRLWATPNDGPGCTFSFTIPCTSEGVASLALRADSSADAA
jgi:PAS domain S-box-containing protein